MTNTQYKKLEATDNNMFVVSVYRQSNNEKISTSDPLTFYKAKSLLDKGIVPLDVNYTDERSGDDVGPRLEEDQREGITRKRSDNGITNFPSLRLIYKSSYSTH